MGVILRAHHVCGEMHILQCNVMDRLQQHPHLTTNCTDRTFLLWRLNLASWASEGFLPGGATRGFSLKYFQGGPKVLKFVIYPMKLKKQPFFTNNFKFQGGALPLFRCPCLAWISHPGHSTILLQSESASSKGTKLHTGSKQQQRWPDKITKLLLVHTTYK